MNKKYIIILLFYLVAFFNVGAQVQGDFISSNVLKYSNKTYTQIVDLVLNEDNSFYSCYESYDYIGGVFQYETNILAFKSDGTVNTNLLNQGILKLELAGFKDIRVKQLGVDSQSKLMVLGNVLFDEAEGIRKGIIIRYNSDGTLDLNFNSLGYRILDTHLAHSNGVNDFVFDTDFNLYIAGMAINPKEQYDPYPVVYKVSPDGTLDLSFNDLGYLVFQSLPANSNVRISHVAGGELKTINLDSFGRVIVAGSLAKGFDSFNFISRLTSSGQIDESFFDGGYYLSNPSNSKYQSFKNSIVLNDNSILYVLNQATANYDVLHARLKDQNINVYEMDINVNEDFLMSMIQTENGVYGIVNTLNTEGFNSLNKPDHNYLIKMYDRNGVSVKETAYEVFDLNLDKIELQKVVYLPLEHAFVVGGKIFYGNQFQSFLYKIETKKVGLEGESLSDFLLFPSISNDYVEISTSNNFNVEGVRIFDGLGKEMLVTALPIKVDIRGWEKGIYFVKSSLGYANKFLVY